jgi:hypothetical protein
MPRLLVLGVATILERKIEVRWGLHWCDQMEANQNDHNADQCLEPRTLIPRDEATPLACTLTWSTVGHNFCSTQGRARLESLK